MKKIILTVCHAVLTSAVAFAAMTSEDLSFVASSDGTTQKYVKLTPANLPAEKIDVVIWLHGHGSDRTQVSQSRGECAGSRDFCEQNGMLLISPDYRAKTSWMGPAAEADMLQLLTILKGAYDVGRVFFVGGSMGGSSALTFAGLHPDLVDGVAGFNPLADHTTYENFQDAIAASFGGSKTEVPDEYAKRSAITHVSELAAAKVPIALTLGGADTSVPPASARQLAAEINAINPGQVYVDEVATRGHETDYDATLKALRQMLCRANGTDYDEVYGGGTSGGGDEPAGVTSADGLVAWWPFGKFGLNDACGNGYALVAGPAAVIGETVTLAGTSAGNVQSGLSVSGIPFSQMNAVTVELWIRYPSAPGWTQELVELSPNFNSNPGSFLCYDDLNAGCVYSGVRTASYSMVKSGSNVLADKVDAWRHIVAVYTKGTYGTNGDNLRLYVDGVDVTIPDSANRASTVGVTFPDKTLYFGGRGGKATVLGEMDSMKVWSRALTADEVAFNYAAGRDFCLLSTVVADELSVKVAVEDFVTCDPVVTATFPAGLQRVAVEWAKAEDGEFTELGAVENPEGTTFAYTNAIALIADKRWYRVTATDADGSASSAAVPFTRFRNLDRCPRERRLLAGFCEPIGGFTTAHMNAFDGNIGTTSDNGSGDLKTGFKFLAPVYIAGLRLYARNDRMNGRTILGAVTSEDYAAGTRIVRSASLSLTTGTWGFVPTTDPDVAYRYCWLEPLRGDCAEMEVYGWTAEDLANPAGDVSFDFTDVSTLEGPSPIITATFQAGVESATLQRGRRADGTFVDLMTVQNPQGTSFVYTNFAAKVGQTVFYRVKTTDGGSTYVSHARPFARFRHLERDPADNSKVRDGYTRLTPGKTQDFDGNLDTYSNGNPHGINFNEQVYVAGLRLAPRVGWGKRLAYRCAYAYRTAEDYGAGNSVRITPWIVGDEVVYRWFDSTDTENAYQYCRIDCDAGDLAEMEIYGWTMADIDAAGDPFFPTSLDGENGAGDGEVVLAWAGGKNLDSYRVQYREKGETEWIDYGVALPTNVESTVVSGFASGVTYEFRVAATGDGETGYSPTAEVLVYHLVPGPGTGLSRTLMATIASRSFDRPLYFERGEVASIDVDETADTLFAHTNFVDALVMYRGKIIIPVTGTYVFGSTVKGSDGQSLFIDGVECFNVFSSAGYKGKQLELTAGEHTFELDYRSVNKTRFLAFTWALQGGWGAQPVPTSQLMPAAEGEFQNYAESSLEGWRFILPTGSSYIPKVWWLGDQSFRMIGELSDFSSANVSYLSQEVKGAFYLDFEPKNKSGRPSLFVRDSKSGQSLAFIVGGDFLGMKDLAGGGDWGGISWTGIAGTPKVRIQRDADGTLRFLCHASNWPNEKWHTLLTMPQGIQTSGGRTVSITSPRLQVGFVLGGNNSARADVRISNFRLTKRGGLVLFVR